MNASAANACRVWGALAVVGLVAAPAVIDLGLFPLSDYPIYANRRGRTATFTTAIGLDSDGTARRLSLEVVADTDDPLIAQSTVADAIAAGEADRLCAAIARRSGPRHPFIAVVTERHDVVRYAAGRTDSLLDRQVVAQCPGGGQ